MRSAARQCRTHLTVFSHNFTTASVSVSATPSSVNKMAKATSKKQNSRANPLSKSGKEARDSKDPKQSHLYTDDNPETTLKGTGFKDVETANKTIALVSKRSLTCKQLFLSSHRSPGGLVRVSITSVHSTLPECGSLTNVEQIWAIILSVDHFTDDELLEQNSRTGTGLEEDGFRDYFGEASTLRSKFADQ